MLPIVFLQLRSENSLSPIRPAMSNTPKHGYRCSTADLAVILVDARQGVLTQTRRHSYLVHLLGIRQIVLAVNKMDLVNYNQACSTKSSPITEYLLLKSALKISTNSYFGLARQYCKQIRSDQLV